MFFIERKDMRRVFDYAQETYKKFKTEVGGMMVIMEDKDGDWVASDPVILKQEVTGGTTTLDADALAVYYGKMAEKYGNNVRFLWWHSHGGGSVFWSSTDEIAIKEFSGGDWSASLVVNIKEEFIFRVDYWSPFYKRMDKMKLSYFEHDVPKKVLTDIDKLVAVKKYEQSNIADNRNTNTRNTASTPTVSEADLGNRGNESLGLLPNEISSESDHTLDQDAVWQWMDEFIDLYIADEMSYNNLEECVGHINTMCDSHDTIHQITLPSKDRMKIYVEKSEVPSRWDFFPYRKGKGTEEQMQLDADAAQKELTT